MEVIKRRKLNRKLYEIISIILFTITDDDLEEFLKAVITANDRGISPLRNATNEMNWSFGQALFFSSTVITTIGK